MENVILDKPQYYGVLEDRVGANDFQLLEGTLNLPAPRHAWKDNQIVYKQDEISLVSCTLHGVLTAISALSGVKFTLEQRQQFFAEAVKLGFDVNNGWYVNSAVDLGRKLASGWLGENLTSFHTILGSPEFVAGQKKGYNFVTSFSGNAFYSNDKNDNNILDEVALTGASTYGHCLDHSPSEDYTKFDSLVVDNYPQYPNNTYKVPQGHLPQLVSNNVFSRNAYVFAFSKDIVPPAAPSLVSPWAINSVNKAKKFGYDCSANPQKIITLPDAELLFKLIGKISVNTGVGLTAERLCVALDNAGLLG